MSLLSIEHLDGLDSEWDGKLAGKCWSWGELMLSCLCISPAHCRDWE